MSMIDRTNHVLICILIVITVLGACNPAPTPTIEGGQISVNPDTEIEINEQATLRIDVVVQGASPEFQWTAERGSVSNPNAPSVIYTAPSSPGPDLVTVVVTAGDTTFTQSTSFDVVEPLPSPTPTLPGDSSTPTATPVPLACELRPTTQNLFPQLYQLFGTDGQFPIHGPVEGAGAGNFHCEVVPNPDPNSAHKPSQTVHITYEKVTDNDGWWGIATPNGYDASQHKQFCFWAYAKQPASFRVKMKDRSTPEKKEAGPAVTINTTDVWEQICTDISAFEDLGINTQQMDNVNLGFEAPLGSAEIWVADLEFR